MELGDTNQLETIEIGNSETSKTLGLNWNHKSDILSYSVIQPSLVTVSKRSILSSISQLFDPLGLLSPLTINAKILIQQLWQLHVSWDESVPASIHTKWSTFQRDLKLITELKIPRLVLINDRKAVELIGFADASESAYSCCVYLRSTDSAGNSQHHLLCAKTRVAPLKMVTIPRLELCSALLLAELMDKVKSSLHLHVDKIFYCSDSTITLSWINTSPHVLKVFVANRVAQIQSLTKTTNWRYINTKENPADLLTRGISTFELINSDIWWNGPKCLSSFDYESNKTFVPSSYENLPETKPKVLMTTLSPVTEFLEIAKLNGYCTLRKLQRVLDYVLCFIRFCRTSSSDRDLGPLTCEELGNSLKQLTRICQQESFLLEIKSLKVNKLNPFNGLFSLNPFIDDSDILRVGGRLGKSHFNYDKKHPAILPKNHHLTKLYAESKHIALLHAGPQLTLSAIREEFWPINGRNLVKQIVHNCIRCFRFNAKTVKYLMSYLPIDRMRPSRPFSMCGTDYAGPFKLRDRKTRNYKVQKCYICLFVCFSTKAVHLELVSDLTTECFIASLRRFTAQRGICRKLFPDHGTNFMGAKNELRKFFEINSDKIQTRLSQESIDWRFIPPNSPHFGGLWEAGVKSVKHHLRRSIGENILTFEEFSTLLTQIESCLNSRPISPLSDDPNDPSPLTPAHFLIGEPLFSIPDHNWLDVNENRRNQYQLIQQRLQLFWKRWSSEYISQLQSRNKWKKSEPQVLTSGTLVLIKEDGLPPLKWSLGRVQTTFSEVMVSSVVQW
ncbi:uncharacterized protein [Diabrotica undecimpunctata]|uniref:uncharacterized protein n=1 Tax=Diabrotica undecimpunctata TaxID=50387 RepID=UPI003B632E85